MRQWGGEPVSRPGAKEGAFPPAFFLPCLLVHLNRVVDPKTEKGEKSSTRGGGSRRIDSCLLTESGRNEQLQKF